MNLTTKEEIKIWLDQMNVKNYIIYKDLTVDINGDVYLNAKNLTELPIQFNVVQGNFYIDDNKLKSLKGCPKSVSEYFNCDKNQLTSLEYSPEYIGGSFSCQLNQLTSLEYAPKIINGHLYCTRNNLKSLENNIESLTYSINYNGEKLLSEFKEFYKPNGDMSVSLQQIKSVYLYQKLDAELPDKNISKKVKL